MEAAAPSGHERWQGYLRAASDERTRGGLRTALGEETDPAIALALLLYLLERVPCGERTEWIDALPAHRAADRAYAQRRAEEIAVLEAESGGSAPAVRPDLVSTYSPWLQLRLAERSADRKLLAFLREIGQTRRIRNLAEVRLRRAMAG